MFIEYQINPCGRSVGDCAVRAIARALDVSWETAYRMITKAGLDMCDMPSSDSVWGMEAPDERSRKEFERFISKMESM